MVNTNRFFVVLFSNSFTVTLGLRSLYACLMSRSSIFLASSLFVLVTSFQFIFCVCILKLYLRMKSPVSSFASIVTSYSSVTSDTSCFSRFMSAVFFFFSSSNWFIWVVKDCISLFSLFFWSRIDAGAAVAALSLILSKSDFNLLSNSCLFRL